MSVFKHGGLREISQFIQDLTRLISVAACATRAEGGSDRATRHVRKIYQPRTLGTIRSVHYRNPHNNILEQYYT